MMKEHPCCYADCPNEGVVHVGMNGNPDTHWICQHHLERWNRMRVQFLAAGLPCEMEELGDD